MRRPFAPARTLLALLLALTAGAFATLSVLAQDATPTASPPAAECVAPALPPGSPTPPEAGGDEAEDGDEEDGEDAGESAATLPAGTPTDAATSEAVATAIATYFACANAGDWAAVVALTNVGAANPYDLVALYQEGGNPEALRSVGDVRSHADGRVSATVVYTGLGNTPYQLVHERWYLVEADDYLLLDAADVLAPVVPAGADRAGIDVVTVDFAFEPGAPGVPAVEYVVLHGVNRGRYDHEIEVKRFPPGASFEQVFADEALQAQTVDIGYLELAPGAEGDLVLVGLEAGTYTMMCFFDEPDGELHALKGMTATFTVG